MAGSVAALSLSESAADVTVFEAGGHLGGAALYSAGRIWTYPELAQLRRYVPLGDADLQQLLVAALPSALKWLTEAGLPLVEQPAAKSGFGMVMDGGVPGNQRKFFDAFANLLAERGVDICLGERVASTNLVPDGVVVVSNSNHQRFDAVVIASGGMQGNRRALRDALGSVADAAFLRSSPTCCGDGFDMGRTLGGASSRGIGTFYGHTLPAVTEWLRPSEFKAATLGVATSSLLVNQLGQRFVDEGASRFEEHISMAGIHQPEGHYYLIGDAYHYAAIPTDLIDEVAARGASATPPVITEETLEALADAMELNWGVPAAEVKAEIGQWNRGTVDPPRTTPPRAIIDPPYIAVRCVPSITLSNGGLAVDSQMQLLGRHGQPIPRVYVAGADAGGVYVGAYAGGLAWATVSGRVAACSLVAHGG